MSMIGYTADERRELVLEYLDLPKGAKGSWLAQQPFSEATFRRWRSAYLAGGLDRDFVPRDGQLVKSSAKRIQLLERAVDQRDDRVARLERQIEQLQATNEALGKAIGTMHERSAHTSGHTPTPPEHEH